MSHRHPLSESADWVFEQDNISIQSKYRIVSGERQVRPRTREVTVSNTCREGLIGGLRGRLCDALCREVRSRGSWGYFGSHYSRIYRLDLEHPSLKQPFATELAVSDFTMLDRLRRADGFYRSPDSAEVADTTRTFIHLADATVGLLNVLLSPDRYQGDWWTSEGENAAESLRRRHRIRYFGVDNTLLYHPALVSLYTGLLRQCALIVGAGCGKEAVGQVDRGSVEEALTNSDPELAWKLFQKMRKWVEVPQPRGAYRENMPVLEGSWPKIPALHKALYAYGFEETFGGEPEVSWNIAGDDPYGRGVCTGVYSYLGSKGTSKQANRIKALAQKTAKVEGGWRKRQTRKT